LVLAVERGVEICGAPAVADEVREWLPTLAAKRGLNEGLLLAAFQLMPVSWKERSLINTYEQKAMERIGRNDPDDWPTVALALALAGQLSFKARGSGRIRRWYRNGLLAFGHWLHEQSMRLLSPMIYPGEPRHKNPKTLLGMLLFRGWLFGPRRVIHYRTIAIWTNDKHFAETGISTITTAELLRMLGE
jgi:hypothetical protein